jgi:hypothetical protein
LTPDGYGNKQQESSYNINELASSLILGGIRGWRVINHLFEIWGIFTKSCCGNDENTVVDKTKLSREILGISTLQVVKS